MHNTNNARWVAQKHPQLHRAIVALPWVSDGLTDEEKRGIDYILYTAVSDAYVAEALIMLPWVKDSMDAGEAKATSEIYFTAHEDAAVARVLMGMSFLSSHEEADTHALNGIQTILRGGLTTALTSSHVFQIGITDEWAPVVAAAAATEEDAAIREYLDEQALTLETGQYTASGLPLTITIVRLRNAAGVDTTMEDARQAIAGVEAVMQLPLPTRHVIIAFDPRAVVPGLFGTNHGYLFGVKQEQPSAGQDTLRSTLRHEAAHYWWRGNINWIDEGMADAIAAAASLAYGDNLAAKPNRRKECTTENLSSLGHARGGTPQFHCNYYLGEKLFRALQDSMTEGEFTAAIQALYRASQAKPEPQTLGEHRAGIDEVRQAFPYQQEIIDLHYSGDINAPHRWDPDDAINTRHHDVVVWTQKPTYIDGVVSFSGSLTGEATLSALSAFEAQQGGGPSTFTIIAGGDNIGSILPARTDGRSWVLDDAADVVADQFEVIGNSFTIRFRWPPAAGDSIGKRIIVWGYNNASRTPEFGNRADSLGTSFIR